MSKSINFKIKDILEDFEPNYQEDDDQLLELKLELQRMGSSDLADRTELTVLLLYTYEGSYARVAKLLDISEATVCTYINRIRKKLNKYKLV